MSNLSTNVLKVATITELLLKVDIFDLFILGFYDVFILYEAHTKMKKLPKLTKTLGNNAMPY